MAERDRFPHLLRRPRRGNSLATVTVSDRSDAFGKAYVLGVLNPAEPINTGSAQFRSVQRRSAGNIGPQIGPQRQRRHDPKHTEGP